MNFTFGIITDGKNNARVNQMVESIEREFRAGDQMMIIDDSYTPEKPSWITKKKNLIAQKAYCDNLVLMHDYITLNPDWRNSWEQFGDDWDYAMNVILNKDGTRYRDWCAWDDPMNPPSWTCFDAWCPQGHLFYGRPCVLPYSYKKTQYTYTSGAYFLVKKRILLDNPFNEELVWGQGEDVEWSVKVRNKYKYVMNTNSSVQLLKQKDVILPYVELT